MKIVVDTNLCSGHARCAAHAPNLIPLDDSGFADVTDPEVPVGQEELAQAAAAACPERAITLLD
jgi:ferredoxin